MGNVFVANRSNVTLSIEGQEPITIEGLQSISYKSCQERDDVAALGTDKRVDVVFGLKIVRGNLKVKSTNEKLNEILSNGTSFQLGANLKTRGDQGPVQRVTFDQCYLDDKEFALDVNNVASTTYYFNATEVREELASNA